MKKRTGVILAVAAFFVGTITGLFASTYVWSRIYGEGTVTHCLYNLSSAYVPLKLLKDGQTEKATQHLQMELHSALTGVEIVSDTLHRPDMLTNSIVVNARAFDKN